MIGNFEQCLALLLKHEGGFVNNPKDPGGATNLGVTLNTWSKWKGSPQTVDDVKNLTVEDVSDLYRQWYWGKSRCDDLPPGVDYCVFDCAVNSGPSQSIKFIQVALDIRSDGVIGPQTIAASHQRDAQELVEQICEERLHFLQSLNTWDTFGKGWQRRVDEVKQMALRMASQ